VHETPDDIDNLQQLLDHSYAHAGEHLRSIVTPDRRLAAKEVCALLRGVCVLNLATVTKRAEPRVAPVDGLFYRGRFWFGSSPTSRRFVHIARRPQVSAAHTRGEALAIFVHGDARVADLDLNATTGFREYLVEVYGDGWSDWGAGALYAHIDASHMQAFAFGDVAEPA
jgi:hypothetical protein